MPHEVGDADGERGRSSCRAAFGCPSGHSDIGSALCRGGRRMDGLDSLGRRRRSRRRLRVDLDLDALSGLRHGRDLRDHGSSLDRRNRRRRGCRRTGPGDDPRLRSDRIGLRDGWSRRPRRRWGRLGGRRARRRLLRGRWSRGRRIQRRDWGGRRRGCRRRVGGTPRREQVEWVDVGVLADPNPEVDVRNRMLGVARRPGICDRVPLRDDRSLPDAQHAEVRKRRLVAVGADDRHREAVRRDLSGERHLPGRGRPYRARVAHGDVDPAMLTRGVLVTTDRVASKHVAVGGPHPRPRGGSGAKRPDDRERGADHPSRCPMREHGATVASVVPDGNAIDCLVTESPGRGRCETRRSSAPPPPPPPVAMRLRRRDRRPLPARPRPPETMGTPRPARAQA